MSESNSNLKKRLEKEPNIPAVQEQNIPPVQEQNIPSDQAKSQLENLKTINVRAKSKSDPDALKELRALFYTLKDNGYFPEFFEKYPDIGENGEHSKPFREMLYEYERDVLKSCKGKRIGSNAFKFHVKPEIYEEYIKREQSEKGQIQQVNPMKVPEEVPKEGNLEGGLQGGSTEDPSVQASRSSEEGSEPPKQNMVALYEDAQKALASVGIETPLNDLLIPLDLKERLIANPKDEDILYDVVREASKNYAINVYRQRYKDIEDSSFREFLRDAINEGLINPYKYFDKNREERVMYLFGDKAMTEPELRDEFNKYRFKNLIKGSKNKLHEFAERAIMKKREKQLEAYKEMKQTTHDATRPKMVLNPMLFNHA